MDFLTFLIVILLGGVGEPVFGAFAAILAAITQALSGGA